MVTYHVVISVIQGHMWGVICNAWSSIMWIPLYIYNLMYMYSIYTEIKCFWTWTCRTGPGYRGICNVWSCVMWRYLSCRNIWMRRHIWNIDGSCGIFLLWLRSTRISSLFESVAHLEIFPCSPENVTCSPENFTCSPENFTFSPQNCTSSPVKCRYLPE